LNASFPNLRKVLKSNVEVMEMRILFIVFFVVACCVVQAGAADQGEPKQPADRWLSDRLNMVEDQIVARGVKDASVVAAMRKVPRHFFTLSLFQDQAYDDFPLPIGEGQTISQPYIVALMTELAEVRPGDKVLEIGTGSGYQAAVLAEITDKVFTIEILAPLAERARKTLDETGYGKVKTLTGDGYAGWPEHAPFDAIIVTAAPEQVPQPLLDQLKQGGRLVIPVGPQEGVQTLDRIRKGDSDNVERESIIPVRFVPFLRATPNVPDARRERIKDK